MKNFFFILYFSVFLISLHPLAERITVGSETEIRTILNPSVKIPSKCRALQNTNPLSVFDNDEFTVTSAYLLEADSSLVLSLRVIPWRTGEIEIKGIDAAKLFPSNEEILVNFAPFQVESAIAENEFFADFAPPLILEGTIYIFFLTVFLLFILLALFAYRGEIAFFSFTKKTFLRISRYFNRRKTVKSLRFLLRSESSDKAFLFSSQKILRSYFASRFEGNFDSKTTSELFASFPSEAPLEVFCDFFKRADFVRFSHSSLSEGEREELLEKLLSAIFSFEEVF